MPELPDGYQAKLSLEYRREVKPATNEICDRSGGRNTSFRRLIDRVVEFNSLISIEDSVYV